MRMFCWRLPAAEQSHTPRHKKPTFSGWSRVQNRLRKIIGGGPKVVQGGPPRVSEAFLWGFSPKSAPAGGRPRLFSSTLGVFLGFFGVSAGKKKLVENFFSKKKKFRTKTPTHSGSWANHGPDFWVGGLKKIGGRGRGRGCGGPAQRKKYFFWTKSQLLLGHRAQLARF